VGGRTDSNKSLVSVSPACVRIVASMSTFAAIGLEIISVVLLAAIVRIVMTAEIVVVMAEVVSTKIQRNINSVITQTLM
jgi:putative effector of murein hydrolase LrgA (UPF0299 family)